MIFIFVQLSWNIIFLIILFLSSFEFQIIATA
jgi:hypothetical protein